MHKVAKNIYDYFEDKYGLGMIGLLKCITVASVTKKNIIPLNLLVVAPSRQYKSRTSKELSDIFPKSYMVHLGSDFTIHSLIKDYDGGKKINNKCCLLNDMVLLFGTKRKETKTRLTSGLAEYLSDGSYCYSDRMSKPEILKGRSNSVSYTHLTLPTTPYV